VAVQTLALDSGSIGRAAILGVAYWAGLALPFVAIALLLARIVPALSWAKRHMRAINVSGGILLIAIGVVMVVGLWRPFLSWVGVIIGGFTPAL
jgi:cytochrome c-type biogenesis protein